MGNGHRQIVDMLGVLDCERLIGYQPRLIELAVEHDSQSRHRALMYMDILGSLDLADALDSHQELIRSKLDVFGHRFVGQPINASYTATGCALTKHPHAIISISEGLRLSERDVECVIG